MSRNGLLMKNNFLLVVLCDNDYCTQIREATAFAMMALDFEKVSNVEIMNAIVQHMVGTTMQRYAEHKAPIDWDDLKRTESYLRSKLKVSLHDKLPPGLDYNSGAAYANLITGDVYLL